MVDRSGVELDSSHPYAGADLPRAVRFEKGLWLAGIAVVLVLLPAFPPTHAVGRAGWWLAAAGLVGAAATFWLVWRTDISWRGLLAVTYFGAVVVTGLSLLAAPEAPYHEIFLLLICGVALMHPLRVSLPYTVLVVGAHMGLALLTPGAANEFVRAGMQSIVWLLLAAVLSGVMTETRHQRLELHLERSIDSLTRLPNRREFDEQLAAAVASHSASGQPLALFVADLNGFKALNDEHGHMEGDAQLVRVAEALVAGVRPSDTCFRWGGDEFAVLLPGANSAAAALVAARAREAVAEACLSPGRLTIGVGHAELRPGDSPNDLLERADSMLLTVKAGRRRPVSDHHGAARLAAAGG